MFIVSLTYTVSLDEIDNFRPAHLNWLQTYFNKGYFLASGRKNPPNGGIIIVHGLSRHQLDELLKEDPFAIQNIATYEVIEFTPKMAAPVLSFLTQGE
jgi:uncharacterized protein YciI